MFSVTPSKDPKNYFHKYQNIGHFFGLFSGIAIGLTVPGRVLPYIKKIMSSKLPETAKMAFIVNPMVSFTGPVVTAHACTRGVVAVSQRSRLPHVSHWAGMGMQDVWIKCDRPVALYSGISVETMRKIRKSAKKKGLMTHKVMSRDSEEMFTGTFQVLVVGPGPDDYIDELTKGLKPL